METRPEQSNGLESSRGIQGWSPQDQVESQPQDICSRKQDPATKSGCRPRRKTVIGSGKASRPRMHEHGAPDSSTGEGIGITSTERSPPNNADSLNPNRPANSG